MHGGKGGDVAWCVVSGCVASSCVVAPARPPWHHRHVKKRLAAAARTTIGPFQKGQVWRIGDVNLAVTSVGKSLVHYKRYRTQPRGVQTTLSSKPVLQKYLTSVRAVLISA